MTSESPEYTAWENMKQRCYNPANKSYDNYGGRGITVCDEWSGSTGFSSFLNDVGERPSPKHSLDRIDNNKGYFPANVRWSTPQTQGLNRRVKRTNKSGVTGVCKAENKWRARITIDYKTIELGRFKSKLEAIQARNNAYKQALALQESI